MIAWLIETLLATTLLMMLVLALRQPVRRMFGSSVAYALWALPVLRLMLPPLPGGWQLSGLITPLLPGTAAPVAAPGPVAEIAPAMTGDMARAADTVAAIAPQAIDAPGRAMLVPAVANLDPATWLAIALALWAVGALLFIGWQLLTYRRFCHRIERQALSRRPLAASGVELIETDAATGPLAFGIWHKVVAFPRDFTERYDEDERDLALAHELTHHARGDLIANWIALVVLGLHWFNPVAWRAFQAFRADQEMACDARVLAGKGAAFAHAYGRAIVKSAHGGAVSAACHLHTINDLKGRLRMLSNGRKSRRRILAGSGGVLALTVAGLGLTASGTQAAAALSEKLGASIVVQAPAIAASAPTPPADGRAMGEGQIAPAAPVAVPLPPSDVAADTPPAPPEPPLPPAPPAPGTKVDRQVIVLKGKDGKMTKHVRVIVRGPDGKLRTSDAHGIDVDIPEVSELNCTTGEGDAKHMVLHDQKDGKQRIIICRNRIEKMAGDAAHSAARAAELAANSKDIERNAYRSALEGLRAARAGMASNGKVNAEGLKAIDQAIAEVEADLAKVN